MRDIYLIAKFSNMDIIILFLFNQFFYLPFSLSRILFHPSFVVQNIPFLLHINRPLYRAKKKDYCLYHTRTHTNTHIQIHIHTLSPLLLTDLLINR